MKKFFALLLTLAMVLSLAACGGNEDTTEEPAGEEAGTEEPAEGGETSNDYSIAVVLKTLSSEYWGYVEAGCKAAEEELGVTITVVGPGAESDIEGQVAQIEQQIGAGCDAIICAPNDAGAAANALQAAIDQGIPVLSVDMTSTGEVACIGDSYYEALLKSLLSVGQSIPKHNVLISSGPARSKVELLSATQMLLKYGFKVYATAGSAEFLAQHGVKDIEVLGWPDEKGAPTVIDYIKQKRIDLVINIPKNQTRRELDNGYKIRRAAIDFNIPLLTNARLASSFIMAVCLVGEKGLAIRSWGSY